MLVLSDLLLQLQQWQKVTKHKKGEVPSPVQDRAVIAAVHNTRTLRAQYVQTTRTPLQATSPQKALALQLGIALLQLPAGHRCRCRALELPPPPPIEGCTVHSAQGSLMQSHGTAQGAPTAYRILHRAAQAAPL